MPLLKRDAGPNALRRGRCSTAGANYMVTLCLQPRLPLLTGDAAQKVLTVVHSMTTDATWALRTAVIMPDHIHLFFTLGNRLTLSQAIGRLKMKVLLTSRLQTTKWQKNFSDHQLRPGDSVEAIIRYILKNPFLAGYVLENQNWPFFFCREEDWSWFEKLTDAGHPFPEWLR